MDPTGSAGVKPRAESPSAPGVAEPTGAAGVADHESGLPPDNEAPTGRSGAEGDQDEPSLAELYDEELGGRGAGDDAGKEGQDDADPETATEDGDGGKPTGAADGADAETAEEAADADGAGDGDPDEEPPEGLSERGNERFRNLVREKKDLAKERDTLKGQVATLQQETAVVQQLNQLQERYGLDDATLGHGIAYQARIVEGDPDMIPILEATIRDLRKVNGLPEPTAQAPAAAAPTTDATQLPQELQDAVDLGSMTLAQARSYAAAARGAAPAPAAQPAASAADAEPESLMRAGAGAAAQAKAQQQELLARSQKVSDQIATWLGKRGATDLQAAYERLIPILRESAPNRDHNQIPLDERFAAVVDAWTTLQAEDQRLAQESERQRHQPPTTTRQTSRGGRRRAAPEPDSIEALYDEAVGAAHR